MVSQLNRRRSGAVFDVNNLVADSRCSRPSSHCVSLRMHRVGVDSLLFTSILKSANEAKTTGPSRAPLALLSSNVPRRQLDYHRNDRLAEIRKQVRISSGETMTLRAAILVAIARGFLAAPSQRE